MSDEMAHGYQTNTEVPVEQVNTQDVANAIDEKLVEQQAAQHQNANDIEKEQTAAENTQEEVKTEESSDSNWDKKFAALSRKEKDVRARETQVEEKLAEINAKLADLEAKSQPIKIEPEVEPEIPLEYRLKKDPIKTLEELGMPYETLTQMVLNDGKLPVDAQMRLMKEELERDYKTKFEELNNKLAEKEQQELEREKQNEETKYNEVITNFKSEINELVDGSEEYELIKLNEAYDLVYDVIEQYYEKNGEILDKKEAADQVESYLLDELTKIQEKSQKLKNRVSVAETPTAQTQRQSPTLSNSLAATGATPKPNRMLSREESIAQLANQIKWTD